MPGIGRVKRVAMQVPLLPLCEHENWFDRVEFGADRFPKIKRDKTGHIGAVTIDIELFNPIAKGARFVGAQLGLIIIEVNDVSPIRPWRWMEIALPIRFVPVRVFGHERIIPCCMVRHPV